MQCICLHRFLTLYISGERITKASVWNSDWNEGEECCSTTQTKPTTRENQERKAQVGRNVAGDQIWWESVVFWYFDLVLEPARWWQDQIHWDEEFEGELWTSDQEYQENLGQTSEETGENLIFLLKNYSITFRPVMLEARIGNWSQL